MTYADMSRLSSPKPPASWRDFGVFAQRFTPPVVRKLQSLPPDVHADGLGQIADPPRTRADDARVHPPDHRRRRTAWFGLRLRPSRRQPRVAAVGHRSGCVSAAGLSTLARRA